MIGTPRINLVIEHVVVKSNVIRDMFSCFFFLDLPLCIDMPVTEVWKNVASFVPMTSVIKGGGVADLGTQVQEDGCGS